MAVGRIDKQRKAVFQMSPGEHSCTRGDVRHCSHLITCQPAYIFGRTSNVDNEHTQEDTDMSH